MSEQAFTPKSDATTSLGSVAVHRVTTINGAAVSARDVQHMLLAFLVADGEVASVPGDTANGLDVDVTRLPRAATATLANVSGSASSVTLQGSNAARLAVEVYNDSSAVLYVKYGSVASSTSFTKQLQAGESFREELYTGIITGIWASATGAARVTELTA